MGSQSSRKVSWGGKHKLLIDVDQETSLLVQQAALFAGLDNWPAASAATRTSHMCKTASSF